MRLTKIAVLGWAMVGYPLMNPSPEPRSTSGDYGNNFYGRISIPSVLSAAERDLTTLALRIENDTAFRLRQILNVSIPLNNTTAYWSLKSDFDKNRLLLWIRYDFDIETKTDTGYMNQYINLYKTSVNLNDHILSINFFFDY